MVKKLFLIQVNWTIIYSFLFQLTVCLKCPEPFVHLTGTKCVYINTTRTTYESNFKLCSNYEATMVTINSREENLAFHKILQNPPYSAWLAGKSVDPLKSRQFDWLNDLSSHDYYNWKPNQPDCHDNQVCCAVIDPKSESKWFDLPCDSRAAQLCQRIIDLPTTQAPSTADDSDNQKVQFTSQHSFDSCNELIVLLQHDNLSESIDNNNNQTNETIDPVNMEPSVQVIQQVSADELINRFLWKQYELIKIWNSTRPRSAHLGPSLIVTDFNLWLGAGLIFLLTINLILLLSLNRKLINQNKRECRRFLETSRLASRFPVNCFE